MLLLVQIRLFLYILFFSGDRELISQIAYELCEDQAKEGVVYFEARYSPHFMSSSFTTPNSRGKSVIRDDIMTPRDVVMAVNDGIRKGCQEFKVNGRTILCLIRPCPGRIIFAYLESVNILYLKATVGQLILK